MSCGAAKRRWTWPGLARGGSDISCKGHAHSLAVCPPVPSLSAGARWLFCWEWLQHLFSSWLCDWRVNWGSARPCGSGSQSLAVSGIHFVFDLVRAMRCNEEITFLKYIPVLSTHWALCQVRRSQEGRDSVGVRRGRREQEQGPSVSCAPAGSRFRNSLRQKEQGQGAF